MRRARTAPGRRGAQRPRPFCRRFRDDLRQRIPAGIAATFDLSIGTLTWRAGVIRQARAHLALDDGALTIRQASALLPGGADVQLTGRLTQGGERPWLEGSADITAENLRAVLSWLDVEADAVPADRLRRLSASADLSARGDRIAASNLDLRIDTTRIAGDASFETGERPRLAARLALDAVNLDAYLRAADAPAAAAGGEAGDEAAASPDPPPPPAPAAGGAGDDVRAALGGIDADVALKIDALTYGGVRFTGLELVSALEDGDATLHRAQVADAAGLSLSITGGARALWSAPTVALAVEGAAASLADLTALLKIDPAIRSEAFGAVALQGSLAGDREALAVDLAVDAGSAEASLTGTIETPFDTPAAALALRLRAADAAVLARTAGLTPPPVVARLGALAIDGRIGGDLDSVALDLHAESAGATLKLSGRIADPLSSPSYRLAVDLSHPRAEALLERVAGAAPAGAALGALHIVGSVSGDATAADIAGIDAALGASRVSGGVFLRLDREPPAFSADLRAGTLDLAWLGGGVAAADAAAGAAPAPAADGSGTGPGAASGTGRWSDEAIDLGLLDRLDGTLSLDAEALILGAYRIEQATAELAAEEGTLTLKSLRGRLFDGALQADGSLSGGSVPAGQAAFRLSGADMGAILLEAAGVDAVSGSATLDGYVTVRGQTARAMVGSLAGRVTLASRGGAVEDVDLPAISRQIGALAELDSIDDIPSFIAQAEQSLSSGRTAIRSLDGTVRVQDGQARIDDVTIVADGAAGTVSGSADLPAWQADLTASFRLVEHPDAPPVGVRLEGPIDRPRRRYLIEDMQAHLVRLGLLSLARAQELPTITIRKGAKAEPGTGMDRLLRNVFGDPEEADGTVEAGADGADDVEDAADGRRRRRPRPAAAARPARRAGGRRRPASGGGGRRRGRGRDGTAGRRRRDGGSGGRGERRGRRRGGGGTGGHGAAGRDDGYGSDGRRGRRRRAAAGRCPCPPAPTGAGARAGRRFPGLPERHAALPRPGVAGRSGAGRRPVERHRPALTSRGGEGESDEALAPVAAHQEQDGLAPFAPGRVDARVHVRDRCDGFVADRDDHVAGADTLARSRASGRHIGNRHGAAAAVRAGALPGRRIDGLETQAEGVEPAGRGCARRARAGLDRRRGVGDPCRELHRLAVAPDRERGGGSAVDGGDRAGERPHVVHRRPVHGGDDVALLQPRRGGRAVRLHAGDDGAPGAVQPEARRDVPGDRLDVDPEPAAHDPAVGLDVVDDGDGRGGGDCEADPHIAAGGRDDGRVHADDLALQVDRGAARIAAVDRRVDLQMVLVGVGAGPASARGDDAEGRGLAHAEGIADGDHPIADAGAVGVREAHGGKRLVALHLEQGEVGPRVAPDHRGIEPRPVVENDGHGPGPRNHVIAGHDVAVRVDDEARADAPARGHGAGSEVGRAAEALGELLAEEALEVLRDVGAAPPIGGKRGPRLAHDLDRDDRRAHGVHDAGEAGHSQDPIDRHRRRDGRGRPERAGQADSGRRDHAGARKGRHDDRSSALR